MEGLFSCPAGGQVARVLTEQGLADESEPEQVLVRRVVTRDGRNRCWVNGRICGASTLIALGEYLVDIHGQHEHQRLLNPRNHLEYLDCFGGEGHQERLAEYRGAYAAWREAKRRAEEAHLNEAERLQQLDILGFQVKEIEQVGPHGGRDGGAGRAPPPHAAPRGPLLPGGEALEALEGEGSGSTETLAGALSALGKAEAVDPRLERLRAELQDAATRVEEAARELPGATWRACSSSRPNWRKPSGGSST